MSELTRLSVASIAFAGTSIVLGVISIFVLPGPDPVGPAGFSLAVGGVVLSIVAHARRHSSK